MFEKGELSAVIANQPAYDGYSGARYVYTADNMGLYLNSVSPEAEVLKDVNFRYALFWGLDRENVVKAVFPTSMPSAYMYLPDLHNRGSRRSGKFRTAVSRYS